MRLLYVSVALNILGLIGLIWLVHRLGGVNYLRYRLAAGPNIGAMYEHKRSQYEELTMEPGATIMLGNSLTEYGDWEEWLSLDTLYNRGIAGDVTDNLLKRLDPIVQARPKRVFLCIGINDLLFHPPEYVLQNYERILERFRQESPTTEVVVTPLLPINNEVRQTGIDPAAILAVNHGLPPLAARYHSPLLEVASKLTDADGRLDARFTLDGIHLNGPAYRIWADALRSYLEQAEE